jgi:hypothetical protein
MKPEILERAKQHFRTQISGEMKDIKVPEWGCTIYVRPMNGMQRDAIMKAVAENKLFEAQVETVIARSLDGDGKKMFSPGQKSEFMREVDPKVISRIASEMGSFESLLDDDGLGVDVDTKNS